VLTAAAESRPDWLEALDIAAWPGAALLMLWTLTTQRGRLLLRPILRRLRKLNAPGGWGVELSEDAAAETYADVDAAIKTYAPVLDAEFGRLAHAERVFQQLGKTIDAGLTKVELDAEGLRATVHIEDALMRNALYQLVDYYPTRQKGAGRRFSTRFGILGQAWRLGMSEVVSAVSTREDDLVKGWGMTRAQAKTAAKGKQSFLCATLIHNGLPVGLLYMDAKPAGIFSDATLNRLRSQAGELESAVGRVHDAIARKGPGLTLLADD
jgi:hypothetical protein